MNINVTLFAQAVVFIAFIWFSVKFIWPHLLNAIETRQKTIADGLAAAERGKLALEVSSKQADEEIAKARGRAVIIGGGLLGLEAAAAHTCQHEAQANTNQT